MITLYIFAFWIIYIATLVAIGHDLYTDYKQNNVLILQDSFDEILVEIIVIILMLIPIVNTLAFLKYSSEQRKLRIQALK